MVVLQIGRQRKLLLAEDETIGAEFRSGSSGTSFLCGNENRLAKRDVIEDQTKMTPMNSMTTRTCGSQLYIEKGAVKILI